MADEKIEKAKPAEIVTRTPEDGLREIEDRVLARTLGIVEDFLHFGDIPLGSQDVPAEWQDELGPERAERRHRLASWAQMGTKDAPVGLKYTKEILVGIVKARATEKAEPKTLNLAITKIDFCLPEFPKTRVER